jgi:hypothetical protein
MPLVRVSFQRADFKDDPARDRSVCSFFSGTPSTHLDVLGEIARVAVDEAGDKTSAGRASMGQCLSTGRHIASGSWQSTASPFNEIPPSRSLAAILLVEEIMLLFVQ